MVVDRQRTEIARAFPSLLPFWDALTHRTRTIAADPRHSDVTLLQFDEVPERRFAGWAMGQINMARLNPALILKYSETSQLDPWSISGHATAAMFDEMIATAAIMGPN